MKIDQMDEKTIADIGHAFAYYDYGAERGLVSAFAQRDKQPSILRVLRAQCSRPG